MPSGAVSVNNHLLQNLSAGERKDVLTGSRLVQLSLRQTICEVSQQTSHVYFLENSLASVITVMSDGRMVEVGMIGPEGIVGASALFGNPESAQQVIVQAPGSGCRIEVARCKELFDKNINFRKAILRFVDMFMGLTAQTAACNSLHLVEARCARWLLMATDRLQSDQLPMTHEFLSAMLGTRRAGVTEVAGSLQRAGLIRYHHGQLTVVDRKGLESKACECYQNDYMRLTKLRKR
jgi:CRP-like cAMP-binding protein